LEYDKFYNDSEYMERQYAIAEPYLNIISGTPTNTESTRRENSQPYQRYQTTYTVPTTTTF
jgi:flagellar basal body rod protein FlgC